MPAGGVGYLANLAVLTALTEPGEVIHSDALNHASIIDACRLARADTLVYEHATVPELDGRPATIVTDAVFSMDGDLAPLAELRALDARLVVDVAHHTGVVPGRVDADVIVGTLSKALGSYGAYIGCDAETRALLINRARPIIYSTALPPSAVGAARAALAIVRDEPERIAALHANARVLREALGVGVGSSTCRSSRSCSANRRPRSTRASARSSRASSPRRSARRPFRRARRDCDSPPAPTTIRSSCGPPVSSLRLYRPEPTVAFGRLDGLRPGYEAAVDAARAHGFAPLEREPGGHAVAYHRGSLVLELEGEGGLDGIHARFERTAATMVAALVELGVDARLGSVAGEYCAGDYSVDLAGRAKLVGLAQRVRAGRWFLGASVVCEDPEPVRAVLTDVYAWLELAFDPATVAVPGPPVAEVEAALLSASPRSLAQ